MVIGLPAVTVRMRAKTTSTQEKMKQKKTVTPIPGAITGISFPTKKWPKEWPSRKQVSSNSRGTAAMKLSRIQIAIGKLSVYTAAAGIHPRRVMPVVLDVGTDNLTLLSSDMYLGERQARRAA